MSDIELLIQLPNSELPEIDPLVLSGTATLISAENATCGKGRGSNYGVAAVIFMSGSAWTRWSTTRSDCAGCPAMANSSCSARGVHFFAIPYDTYLLQPASRGHGDENGHVGRQL